MKTKTAENVILLTEIFLVIIILLGYFEILPFIITIASVEAMVGVISFEISLKAKKSKNKPLYVWTRALCVILSLIIIITLFYN